MNAPANLSINEQIRARDGDDCWLCGFKLDFSAEPNSKKAPTREHLLAQSLGGTNDLANLVLCHPGCNKALGVRPVEKKLEMRGKLQANKAKLMAARLIHEGVTADRAAIEPEEARGNTVSAAIGLKADAPQQTRTSEQFIVRNVCNHLLGWQIATVLATGLACLFLGLLIGLLVG